MANSRLDRLEKNYLINGNFDIWQRGATRVSSSDLYFADRWRIDNTGTNTITREVATGLIETADYFHRVEFGASGGMQMFQALERGIVRDISGDQVTFSFKMKRNATYTGGVQVRIQSNPAGNIAGGAGWTNITTIDIDNADMTTGAFTTYSATFTVPSVATASGFRINFVTPTLQSAGAQLDIAQTMLNKGTNVADFSYFAEDIIQEIQVCQRYCCKSYDLDIPPGSAISDTRESITAFMGSATTINETTRRFPVTMRAAPTINTYNSAGTANVMSYITEASSNSVHTNFSIVRVSTEGFNIVLESVAGGVNRGRAAQLLYLYIAEAEL